MATVEVGLREDEAFPDYELVDVARAEVVLEVPADVAERWRAAREAWDEAQAEIYSAFRAVFYGDRPELAGQYGTPPVGQAPPYPGRRV